MTLSSKSVGTKLRICRFLRFKLRTQSVIEFLAPTVFCNSKALKKDSVLLALALLHLLVHLENANHMLYQTAEMQTCIFPQICLLVNWLVSNYKVCMVSAASSCPFLCSVGLLATAFKKGLMLVNSFEISTLFSSAETCRKY